MVVIRIEDLGVRIEDRVLFLIATRPIVHFSLNPRSFPSGLSPLASSLRKNAGLAALRRPGPLILALKIVGDPLAKGGYRLSVIRVGGTE